MVVVPIVSVQAKWGASAQRRATATHRRFWVGEKPITYAPLRETQQSEERQKWDNLGEVDTIWTIFT